MATGLITQSHLLTGGRFEKLNLRLYHSEQDKELAERLRSFAIQIADLSLKVFIPIERLVVPQRKKTSPRLPLFNTSFVGTCYKNPLKYFKRSEDLKHFESILRILDRGQLRRNQDIALRTLSRYFQALRVYEGTLTATHWASTEDKLTLSVWSMLSYCCHCFTRFAGEFPGVIEELKQRLAHALETDTPLLREVFDYELLKEQRDELVFQSIELKVRRYYELKHEKPALEKGGGNSVLWGISAIANFPLCRKLGEIKERRLFSFKEKREQAEKIWESLGLKRSLEMRALSLEVGSFPSTRSQQSHLDSLDLAGQDFSLKEQVMRTKEVVRIQERIEGIEKDIEKKKTIIDRRASKAALIDVKRVLQGLFEYEQLQIGLECTQRLLEQKTPSREMLVQWLVVIREGLKVMVPDSSLNIPTIRSHSSLTHLIKDIRDYYEHPEQYVLRLDYGSKRKQEEQIRQLEAGLFEELRDLGKQLSKTIEMRLKKMKKIVTPHPSITPEDALKAFATREQAQGSLAVTREVEQEKFPKMVDFAGRVLSKREAYNKGLKADVLFDPFPHGLGSQELKRRLQEACQSLRTVIPLDRTQFRESMETNATFRLEIQRKVSSATRLLEHFLSLLKNNQLKSDAYENLEELYFEARDARNFQTHDLWRRDIKGTINTAYLLAFDCPEVLSTFGEMTPYKAGSLEEQMIDGACQCTLTMHQLNEGLSQGLDVNAYDDKRRTLLHFLALNPCDENLQMAQKVLDAGGNLYAADCVQMRPLHYAAEVGFLDLVTLLVERGAATDVRSKKGTPVEVAQGHEHFEVARFLLAQEGVRRSSEAKALLDAVKNLDVARVEALLNDGFDPAGDFEGALPLVALFEESNVDRNCQLAIAELLIQAGADVNQQEPETGNTAIHTAACSADDPQVVALLMSHNPNLSLKNGNESTPLHEAISNESDHWIHTLLPLSISLLEEKDNLHQTPLMSICNRNQVPVPLIRHLLAHGADVAAANQYGTVLHHLAERGGSHAVAVALDYGASPFAIGKSGLYSGRMPYELSRSMQVTNRLIEKMQFLFSHLSNEDQEELITTAGQDLSPFQDWKRPIFPTTEQEREFLGRLYQRRFCWIS